VLSSRMPITNSSSHKPLYFPKSARNAQSVSRDHVMLSGKLMPKTPKGHKRPADVIANAVHVMKIATGEIDETTPDGKNAAAVSLGRRGGLARAAKLSKRKRVAIARQGGEAAARKRSGR